MAARQRRILPGFGLSLGYTMAYLALIVLIPLGACALRSAQITPGELQAILSDPRVIAALKVSFGTALAAALINGVLGLVIAWVLVRYRFLGKRVIDALIDFPFALPTAVAGLTFADLFVSNANRTGWLAYFWNPMADFVTTVVNVFVPGTLRPDSLYGVYTPFAIVLVLLFTGFPFVVRTVQPVLEDLDPEIEEAAACLGASRWQVFRRIILPAIVPAWITGTALAFARGVGEYGSVVFVSGNMRMRTEIVPVLIVEQLDQFKYAHATVLAMILLVISFGILLTINLLSAWSRRHA